MGNFALHQPVIPAALAMLVITGCVTGCAGSGERRAESNPQAGKTASVSRVERVFRYQSRIANEVFDRYPMFDALENAASEVIAAEARMTESCSPIAQAVLTNFEGGTPSLALRFAVFTSIDDCERAAEDMDALLRETAEPASI